MPLPLSKGVLFVCHEWDIRVIGFGRGVSVRKRGCIALALTRLLDSLVGGLGEQIYFFEPLRLGVAFCVLGPPHVRIPETHPGNGRVLRNGASVETGEGKAPNAVANRQKRVPLLTRRTTLVCGCVFRECQPPFLCSPRNFLCPGRSGFLFVCCGAPGFW